MKSIPGFSAEAAVDSPRGHYARRAYTASAKLSSVQPQLQNGQCYCTEPDTRTVCTTSGCYEKKVCLQWFCPHQGGEWDPESGWLP
jgi:hypothetical protein